MENPTAFDLSFAMKRWRDTLAQSPALQGGDLDELESHLRDAMDGLQARGLSTEEAFLVAARRVGRFDALGREFGKVNPAALWRDRAVWMLAGMLFLTVGWDVISTFSSVTTYVGSTFSSDGLMLGWLGWAVQMGMFVALVWGFWRLANGRFSGLGKFTRPFRQRPVLGVAGALVGLVLLHFTPLVFQMLYIRNLGPVALGQNYLVQRWFTAFTPLIQLALMIVVLARLRLWRSGDLTGPRLAAWALILPVALGLTLAPAAAQTNAATAGVNASEKQVAAMLDQAMTLWRAGKQDEAVAKFLAVDFSRRPLFPTGSVLNLTETQFIALPEAARTKLAKQMNDDLKTVKELAAQTRNTAKSALASGDKTKSDKCLAELKACGQAFDQPDSLALLKLVGRALEKMSAAPLK